jgi:hypothetical protein
MLALSPLERSRCHMLSLLDVCPTAASFSPQERPPTTADNSSLDQFHRKLAGVRGRDMRLLRRWIGFFSTHSLLNSNCYNFIK